MRTGRPLDDVNSEAVALRKQGLMYREVAERQGRTFASVRSALERARHRGELPDVIKTLSRPRRMRGATSRTRQPTGEPKPGPIEMFVRTEVLTIDAVSATLRDAGGQTYHMRAIDVIPCTRCGLRGHVAGDPDRCLHGVATQGLGGDPVSQPMRRRAA